jgi:hypothetical protein
MVLIGEGLSANPGSEIYARVNSWKMAIESGGGPARLLTGARNSSPMTESTQYDLRKELDALANLAQQRGVLIYALNPGHNERSGGKVQEVTPADIGADFVNSAANMSGYDLLVRPTGGMSFYGTPPKQALERVGREIGSYYSVGFRGDPSLTQPKIAARSKQGHRIRIARAAGVASVDDMMRLAVLAHHVAPPDTNDLRISVAVGEASMEGNRRRVPLKILIPVALLRLEPEGDEIRGGFVVYVCTSTTTGAVSRINRQSHEIRWPAAALEQARTKNMTFAVEVVLPQGAKQISVGVLDERSQQTGFDLVPLNL